MGRFYPSGMAPSDSTARAAAVLTTPDPADFGTTPVQRVTLDLGGIPGDRHHGLTRTAQSWDRAHPTGVPIRNRRQLTLVSVEELAVVAELLGLAEVRPEWLGANVAVEGLADLTALPAGSILVFASGAALTCEGENDPCRKAGARIARESGVDSAAGAFVKAAAGRRGILCSVERAGVITAGDEVRIYR
jgi:MOSC domain-containing protein YiiM